MKPIYGKTIRDKSEDYFLIEVKLPEDKSDDPHPSRWGQRRFARYYSHAFNDRRDTNPETRRYDFGGFDKYNPDLASKDRLADPSGQAPRFSTPEAAMAYAAELQEHGIFTAAEKGHNTWGTPEQRMATYGGPLEVRVVRVQTTSLERIVTGLHP